MSDLRPQQSEGANPKNRSGFRGLNRAALTLTAVGLASVLLLSGCKVGPNFVSPKAEMPGSWTGATATDLIAVHKALGGGWEAEPPVQTAAASK